MTKPKLRIGLIGSGFMGKAHAFAGFLDAVAGRRPEPFNFRAGLRIQTLVETIHASSRAGAWKEVP
jgi:predicted dehydrogenase